MKRVKPPGNNGQARDEVWSVTRVDRKRIHIYTHEVIADALHSESFFPSPLYRRSAALIFVFVRRQSGRWRWDNPAPPSSVRTRSRVPVVEPVGFIARKPYSLQFVSSRRTGVFSSAGSEDSARSERRRSWAGYSSEAAGRARTCHDGFSHAESPRQVSRFARSLAREKPSDGERDNRTTGRTKQSARVL